MKNNIWHKPRKPAEIEPRPWLADNATTFFDALLQPEYTVCEFGGGGSTLWLAARVARVVTYEPRLEWMDAIRAHNGDNVELHNAASPEIGEQFDVLFIDGEPVEKRAEWISKAAQLVKPRGFIVLDNANRPEYAGTVAEFQAVAKLLAHFVAPVGKYLVTDFYRLK